MNWKSVFLNKVEVHPVWLPFLLENEGLLLSIEEKIENWSMVTPEVGKVLRFLTNDITRMKILILGQDPYPQSGVATGRAFEVNGLYSWESNFRNSSLKNILRAIYAAYYDEILKYKDIIVKIRKEEFLIAPPDQLFSLLEQQGVLFLNTAFTCEIGKPGVHMKLWSSFSAHLLRYIAFMNSDLIWFLWGNYAAEQAEGLKIQKINSSHPMICCNKPGDFLFDVNMFKKTKDKINWMCVV